LKEGRFRLDIREVLYYESAAQRSCGCPIPGGVQGQVGWGPGQPGLILNVSLCLWWGQLELDDP